MDISQLLIQPSPQQSAAALASPNSTTTKAASIIDNKRPIPDDELMLRWKQVLHDGEYMFKQNVDRNSLTDGYIWPTTKSSTSVNDHISTRTPIHIKVIGRHMNGSFRCHIGTGKASRPIESIELCNQMRLLAVFFRVENSKSRLVSPDFIFFPTWLLHLFRYTKHGSSPGRTDIRFLENALLAKEDHIYRLNSVLNTLFRFNLHSFDHARLHQTVQLARFLFDTVGLNIDDHRLPRPNDWYSYYARLIHLLQAPRPVKPKPMCHNCNSKPASRRRLCVACYRYQLKHDEPRPLRLIVANQSSTAAHDNIHHSQHDRRSSSGSVVSLYTATPAKRCANCGVHETHQWYRNLCGTGHWCETCKSYYLRHTKVRPAELFVKAAKRKVDVRALVSWWPPMPTPPSPSTVATPTSVPPPFEETESLSSTSSISSDSNSPVSSPSSALSFAPWLC
ncbi:hypothetical protein K492DRAFT_178236 [Lichtheimia hyalospora FSU 10163]|nr:hypothetical protein K492DRAFT_178236 [Lichtheimia hyalospora FSU 10163]